MITIQHASFAYEKENILKDISVNIKKQIMTGIIGPNGCGKTTLIKVISGILTLNEGKILLDNKEVQQFSKKELARKVAVLSQHMVDGFQFTVYEIVCLGRYAHQKGLFTSWTDDDERIVREMMERTGIVHMQDRMLDSLSGGERQRVFLAQCLTQQPDIIILDEPTNHLDIKYQIEICEMLRDLVITKKITVICIFHDVNLASLFCDEMILMRDGQIVMKDSTDKVLSNKNIKETFHMSLSRGTHPVSPKPQIYIEVEQDIVENWTINLFPEENIILSNLDLKCMSTVEGMTWRRSFVLEDFFEYTQIDTQNDQIKVIIANRIEKQVILVFIDGKIPEVEYIRLLVYLSSNKKFDDIIIGATCRNRALDNIIDLVMKFKI